MIQNKLGDETERNVANYFKANGYWCYILPKKIGGQPFDIVACKENDTWLIDAKHLEINHASFTFDRIEPNQESSMRYAKIVAGMKNMGFFIEWERDPSGFYFLPYDLFIEKRGQGCKSVKLTELEKKEWKRT